MRYGLQLSNSHPSSQCSSLSYFFRLLQTTMCGISNGQTHPTSPNDDSSLFCAACLGRPSIAIAISRLTRFLQKPPPGIQSSLEFSIDMLLKQRWALEDTELNEDQPSQYPTIRTVHILSIQEMHDERCNRRIGGVLNGHGFPEPQEESERRSLCI
jgi:hypothetical protein